MDWFVKVLGLFMIGMMLFVVFTINPPLAEALEKSLLPTTIDFNAIVTIVGGTVGGYITFSGAHRLLDAGIHGENGLPQANRSAITAIGAASLMRILLFLASLGVVAQGLPIDPTNPPASVFQLAAGNWGFKLFGLVIWAAAITSVVGTSFTSISFAQSWHPIIQARKAWFTVGFIALATLSFAIFGKPIKVLIFAGTFNGLILAFSLGLMLLVAKRLKGYPNINVLWWLGWAVVALMGAFGVWVMLV
jgi:Mn2+/Fe2+ NRAMP family transporter